ncbi:hypothetical protein ABPG73_008896 [Tetrahymena malaccensis]
MNIQKLDIFSSPFQFNYGIQNKRKDQNQTVDREEELKEEGIQQVFVPSFDTKLIQSLDPTQMLSPKNQEQQLLSISPKSQNNRFFLNVQAEQKLQVKKQSMFNQEVSLNSEQRRKQRKIKIANSQLQKQNSFSDSNQIQNTICESQEAIKEPFKGLSKYAHFKRSQSIYSEGLQNSDNIQQIDKTQKFKSTQELFRVSDYQQSLGLGTCDKRAIDDHINQSLDIFKINIDQFQNNIEVSTLKSQETSQEKLYLPQTRINSQKNAYNLNSESHQGHLKIDHSESIQKISSYYKKVFESIQNTSLMKKIKIIIYKTRLCRKKQYLKSKGLDIQHKNVIEDEVTQNFDILQIYKDLLLIKKAILILLSKDQLAALQLVGLSQSYLQLKSDDKNLNKQISFNQTPGKLSHLEEQFYLLKQNVLQQQYINSFFNRICNNKNISDVDQRILSSLQ